MNNVTASGLGTSTTMLGNQSYYVEERGSPDQAVVFCGFMIPFLVIGVFGHVTVLLSVLFNEDLHRPLNVMIVSLSVSQFFMLMISVFGDVIVMLNTDSYDDSRTNFDGSDGTAFLTLLFSTSTSVSYGLIALNRLVSTVFESLYNRLAPWKMVWILVVTGWVLSLIAAIFPWMTGGVIFYMDTYFILGAPWFQKGRTEVGIGIYWLLTCAYLIIPTISAVLCYATIIFYTFRTQRLSGLPVNSPRAINLRDRARVVLMLVTATAVYVVCFYLPLIYWSQPGGRQSRTGQYFFIWLVFVQNTVNPIIYGLINPQFREAYLRVFILLLRKGTCKNLYRDDKIHPGGGGESMDAAGGPPSIGPSVIYHSAKNSVHYNLGSIHENAVAQARSQMPTSARNLQLTVKELRTANRGAESQ